MTTIHGPHVGAYQVPGHHPTRPKVGPGRQARVGKLDPVLFFTTTPFCSRLVIVPGGKKNSYFYKTFLHHFYLLTYSRQVYTYPAPGDDIQSAQASKLVEN